MQKAEKTGGSLEDSDKALAYKASTGDSLALQQIYQRYTRSLFAFIAHHLGESHQESEDIWQETWIAAVHALRRFRGESRFFTWLCSIARHKIADHFRKVGRSQDIFTLDPYEEITVSLGSEPIPEEILADKGVRLRVIETLMSLPIDYRDALLLRYADELSVADVARKINRNYKSTESLLSRARKAFQVEYERKDAEEKKDETG